MHVTSKRLIWHCAIWLLISIPCSAQVLTLDSVLQEAVSNNPELLAAGKDLEAVEASYWDKVAPDYPGIFLEYEGIPEGASSSDYESRKIGISQEIDFPFIYILNGRKNKQEQQSSLFSYMALKNDIKADVKKRFYEVLFHTENQRLYGEIESLSDRMLSMARIRVMAGESAPYDTLRAKVDRVDVENLLLSAGRDRKNALYGLKLLLGRKKVETFEISGDLKYNPLMLDGDALKEKAIAARPELKLALSELEMSKLDRKLTLLEQLPSFEVSYFNHTLPGSATPDNWGGGIGLTIPLWGLPKGKSAVNAATHRRDAVGWRIESIKRTVLEEVDEAWSRLMLTDSQVRKYQESVLGVADELVRIATKSYEAGEMGYYETAEAYRSMYRTRASYAEALFTWHTALADLERAVGVSLTNK